MNFVEGKFYYCNNGDVDCIGVYWRHFSTGSGNVRVLSVSGYEAGEFIDFHENDLTDISSMAIKSIFIPGKGITWGIKSAFYVIEDVYNDAKSGWTMKLKDNSGFVDRKIVESQKEGCNFDKAPGVLPTYDIGQRMIQNKRQENYETAYDLSDPPVLEDAALTDSKESLFEKKFFLVDGHSGCVDVYNGQINIHIKSLSDLEEAQEFINFCIEKGIYK